MFIVILNIDISIYVDIILKHSRVQKCFLSFLHTINTYDQTILNLCNVLYDWCLLRFRYNPQEL